MKKGERIKEKGRELGFHLVGLTRALPPPDTDFFRWWLDQGFAGTMDYLRRGLEKRADPGKILPGVRSVICCALNYYVDGPRRPVARYAWGDDYHKTVGERLKKLEAFLREKIDAEAKTKSYVDTGPVLERSYAAWAGLGWIGKNACLIHPKIGSFFVLGEILTTLEFEESEYDRPVADRCGDCTKCLEACPTKALVSPHVLDARRCLSYLTPAAGCDICQEVCPFNERIRGEEEVLPPAFPPVNVP